MAVLGTGSWTLSSGPRVTIENKRKYTISRWTIASGSYKNGIKTPPIGQFGLVRNVETMRVVASATSVTQHVAWQFDRVNRKLRAFAAGSGSLVTTIAGRFPLGELTSKSLGATASQLRARIIHVEAIGW